jgi:hypothetical protein
VNCCARLQSQCKLSICDASINELNDSIISPLFGDVLLSILAVGANGITLPLLNAGVLCTALALLVVAAVAAVRSGTSVCIKGKPSAPNTHASKVEGV